jgi:ferritin-like metal-binding protein YciE
MRRLPTQRDAQRAVPNPLQKLLYFGGSSSGANLQDMFHKIFKSLGAETDGKAIKGLVEKTEELMREASAGDGAGLIGCAGVIDHSEMARYGTLKAWAKQLEMEDAMAVW